MKRRIWALCLGVVTGSSAMAQPPAETERYPLAPEMPGTVVSKPVPGARPTATVTEMQIKPAAFQNPATPFVQQAPVVTATQLPYSTTITAQTAPIGSMPARPITTVTQGSVMPVNGVSMPMVAPMNAGVMMPSATCAPGTECAGGLEGSKLAEWLKFQSTSKQTGHYPPAATPPLTAWFPCKTSGNCAAYATPRANCATGNCNIMPAGLLPGTPVSAPQQAMPIQNVEGRLMPGVQASTATSFQKVVPSTVTPGVADPLSTFRKMEGMSFTSGWAPMAAPAPKGR